MWQCGHSSAATRTESSLEAWTQLPLAILTNPFLTNRFQTRTPLPYIMDTLEPSPLSAATSEAAPTVADETPPHAAADDADASTAQAGQKRRRPTESPVATAAPVYPVVPVASDRGVYRPGSLIDSTSELATQARIVAANLGADFDVPAAVQQVTRYERAVAEVSRSCAEAAAAAAAAPDNEKFALAASQQAEALAQLRRKLADARADAEAHFRRNLRDEIARVSLLVCARHRWPGFSTTLHAPSSPPCRETTSTRTASRRCRPKCTLCSRRGEEEGLALRFRGHLHP